LDKIVGVLLIAILALVSVTSLSYYILSQSNQNQSNPSPTPTSTSSPTPPPSPSETPTDDSITVPSAPEFTLKLVDYMVGGGIETQIQNQPIIPNGHDSAGIFFDRRFKWHESTTWYHPEPDPTKWKRQYISQIGTTGVTTLVGSPNSYYEILGSTTSHQLDVQYRAINGYLNESVPFVPPIGIDPNDTPVVVVNTSEWSETVTINLPDYNPEI
jgi:hypothetical protein